MLVCIVHAIVRWFRSAFDGVSQGWFMRKSIIVYTFIIRFALIVYTFIINALSV